MNKKKPFNRECINHDNYLYLKDTLSAFGNKLF
jgi:hypothetical protein